MLVAIKVFCFVILSFGIFTSPVFAENLLLNSSFEDITSGVPNSWTKNVSTATLSTSSIVKTGTASASINKTNSTTGTIYLYQDIDVEPNSYYSLSGWAVKNDSKFSYVLLRVSWRDSSVEISKTDSPQLTSDSPTFQELKINSVQAPSQSVKARVELLANISTLNPSNPALFDDVNFSQVTAPEQPTSTPASSATSTQTPTATSTPAPTMVKTPTPTPTKTPTPLPSVNATTEPTAELSVLALETNASATPEDASGSAEVLAWAQDLPIIPIVLIILGASTFAVSGFMYLGKRKVEGIERIEFDGDNNKDG